MVHPDYLDRTIGHFYREASDGRAFSRAPSRMPSRSGRPNFGGPPNSLSANSAGFGTPPNSLGVSSRASFGSAAISLDVEQGGGSSGDDAKNRQADSWWRRLRFWRRGGADAGAKLSFRKSVSFGNVLATVPERPAGPAPRWVPKAKAAFLQTPQVCMCV